MTAAGLRLDWQDGMLRGEAVHRSHKMFADLRTLFADGATAALAPETELYSVQWFGTASQGTAGALQLGCTHLMPGKVGNEFFMTHGHFHVDPSRAEIYITASGEGILLRMERGGRTWAEAMSAGTMHAIDGAHGHRVINTGAQPLVFWAAWHADAGYDYVSIARDGFGLRVCCRDGAVALVLRPPVEASA